MNIKNKELIYGKDTTERVVCVEPQDGFLEMFIENNDGSITSKIVDNRYWFLSNINIDNKFTKLTGYNEFKYLVDIEKKQNFYNTINYCQKKDADIYTNWNFKDQTLIRKGITYFKGMNPQDVSLLSFDIETSGVVRNNTSKVYLITNTFRKNGKYEKVLFNLEDYDNQFDMLLDWCDWVTEKNPSLIIGHNIFMFDFPYLIHTANLGGVKLNLGRDNSEIVVKKKSSQFRKDGSQSYEYHDINIFGREIIDTMFLSIKYDIGRKYESYGLKAIVKHEGLEKEGRSFIDASKIREYYENRHANPEMWKKTVQYAIEDSEDPIKLYDLMIPAFFYQCQTLPVCFQNMINKATGSQINSFMVRAYLQNNHSIPKATPGKRYEGATSFGIPGLYKNAFKVDVASLYPSIMREYRVYNPKKDPLGLFLEAIEYFTIERLKNKQLYKETGNKYYKDLSESQKVFVNSAYGFLGAEGLNFNFPDGAEFVTAKGREILDKAIQYATNKMTEYWISKSKGLSEEEECEE